MERLLKQIADGTLKLRVDRHWSVLRFRMFWLLEKRWTLEKARSVSSRLIVWL